jgi:hypothetical protein
VGRGGATCAIFSSGWESVALAGGFGSWSRDGVSSTGEPADVASYVIVVLHNYRSTLGNIFQVGFRVHTGQAKRETTAITEEDVTDAFDVMVCREVDAFEARARRIAEKTRCNETLILDALTIEMTGRFIGRLRDRDAQTLKNQPVV